MTQECEQGSVEGLGGLLRKGMPRSGDQNKCTALQLGDHGLTDRGWDEAILAPPHYQSRDGHRVETATQRIEAVVT